MSANSDRAAEEWEAAVTNDGNILAVDRQQIGDRTTRPIPVHHRGHATGAALVLQRSNSWLTTSSEERAEYPSRVQMFLLADPNHQGGLVVLDRPLHAYWAHGIECGSCGRRVRARGIKLLELALAVLSTDKPGSRAPIKLP